MPAAAPTTNDVLATAIEGHAADICVIPARADGSKRPVGASWERWQSERPSLDQIHRWFDNGHPGIGIVCGDISGNLEMLELEGVAVAGGVGLEVTRLAREMGVGHIIERLRTGYFERTPSDGVHWIYRVDGSPVPGNTKLARRNATAAELVTNPDDKIKTLIETRGEGGFTIIAPSHGTTHPTGRPWKLGGGSLTTIPTLTTEDRDQLHAVCRKFDTLQLEKITVKPVAAGKRITPQAFTGHVGESWIDTVAEHLAATVTWDQLLSRYGWRYLRQDRHGSDLYCRPGKDDGVGGWIKNDRLNVFSTSTPLDADERTTHDRIEAIAAYEHAGDRTAAARAVAEATGILDTWKQQRDTQALNPRPSTDGVDTDTGEKTDASPVNLPDEFWNARPFLQHIRQAAHSRTVCADSVLLVAMIRYATLIPPTTTLPPVVASRASLNTFGAIVSQSGGGKSTSVDVGSELVPITYTDIVDNMPPGSGEGLIELYLEMVDDVHPDTGKKVKVKRQTKRAAFVFVDEGQSLIAMGERSGSTVLQTLRSAWSGQVLGQSNAAQETNRRLAPHRYRMGLVMGFQLRYAADIIADAEGGTPQRFLFVSATDPAIPEDAPDWPGALPLHLPDVIHTGVDYTIDDDVAAEIRKRHHMKATGKYTPDELDGHADLVRMKVAAVFAGMDGGRQHIGADDWWLAGLFMTTSRAVRAWAIEVARYKAAKDAEGKVAAAANREAQVADTLESRALVSGAKSIARKVHKSSQPVGKGDLHAAVASKHRAAASVDDMIAHAEHHEWIQAAGDAWIAGGSQPA